MVLHPRPDLRQHVGAYPVGLSKEEDAVCCHVLTVHNFRLFRSGIPHN